MKRFITLFLCAVFSLLLLTGCTSTNFDNSAINVNDLEGRRVGVFLGWSPDYMLTGREDMNLMRYNEMGVLLLAMKSKKIDAIAVDYGAAQQIQYMMPALKMIEEPVGYDDYVVVFPITHEELQQSFNEFLADFIHTDTYKDIVDRAFGLEKGEYKPVDVALTGDGPVIKVVSEVVFPYIYYDFTDGSLQGSDIEIIKHFANAMNYQLDIELTGFDAAVNMIFIGSADLFIAGLSSYYADEAEASQMILVSDPYMQSKIHFMVVEDSTLFDGLPEGIIE